MEKQYIEKRDKGYWIAETRVSLDSVVLAFSDGLSPETIVAECFPVLTLEQVYGTIAYYLSHRNEIDAYLKKGETESAPCHCESITLQDQGTHNFRQDSQDDRDNEKSHTRHEEHGEKKSRIRRIIGVYITL